MGDVENTPKCTSLNCIPDLAVGLPCGDHDDDDHDDDNDDDNAVLILQMTEYDDTKNVECRYCVCARQQDRHTIEVNIGLPPFSAALALFPTQQINLFIIYHII